MQPIKRKTKADYDPRSQGRSFVNPRLEYEVHRQTLDPYYGQILNQRAPSAPIYGPNDRRLMNEGPSLLDLLKMTGRQGLKQGAESMFPTSTASLLGIDPIFLS